MDGGSVRLKIVYFVAGTALSYEIIESMMFEKGKDAMAMESHIKKSNVHLRYEGNVRGLQGGYTEMFTENVWVKR